MFKINTKMLSALNIKSRNTPKSTTRPNFKIQTVI